MDPESLVFIVNGKKYLDATRSTITFEEIVQYSSGETWGAASAGFTVLWSWRPNGADRVSGSITPGQSVVLQDGMVFNAAHTGAS